MLVIAVTPVVCFVRAGKDMTGTRIFNIVLDGPCACIWIIVVLVSRRFYMFGHDPFKIRERHVLETTIIAVGTHDSPFSFEAIRAGVPTVFGRAGPSRC